MQRLRTVLLRHARRQDTHYDWMLETPGPDAASAGLLTFRVASPWDQWLRLGRLPLTPLPPHRRAYLQRQGPVSGDRGFVTRVASGTLDIRDWHDAGGVLELRDDRNSHPPLRLTLRLPSHGSANHSATPAELLAVTLGPAPARR